MIRDLLDSMGNLNIRGRFSLTRCVVAVTILCYLVIALIFWKTNENELHTEEPISEEFSNNNQPKRVETSASSSPGSRDPLPVACKLILEDVQSKWKSHQCYALLGVDGTLNSFKQYVHQIWPKCYPEYASTEFAEPQADLARLLELVKTDEAHQKSDVFMRQRIERMWPQWIDGLNRYRSWIDKGMGRNHETERIIIGLPRFYKRRKLHIHLHLGFLTLSPSVGIEEAINTGGPLGELVQWTDLIVALYLLGHQITVSKNVLKSSEQINQLKFDDTPCNGARSGPDLIYTDILGFKQLEPLLRKTPKCKYRILDSFGTENKYNLGRRIQFSGLKLNLQQFQTFFPHTPDNTFLGFVIETVNVPADRLPARPSTDKPIALVAGKVLKMWQDASSYLAVLSEFFNIHGNVADAADGQLPNFVTNHKAAYGNDYLNLLRSAKVLVGLGFPYESPAPLEAIANGVIFLNVNFTPPHCRSRTKFFADKPTDRELTSQHPYIERYVGEPYSYLMSPEDANQVRATVRRLLAHPVYSGYIPFEFTPTGYLERLNAQLERQNFCRPTTVTPTRSFFPVLAPAGWSCNRACEATRRSEAVNGMSAWSGRSSARPEPTDSNLVSVTGYLDLRYDYARPRTNATDYWSRLRCAPEYFATLNNPEIVATIWPDLNCKTVRFLSDTIAPFRNLTSDSCTFQSEPLHYSCTYPDQSQRNPEVRRICPCRDSIPGQSTLCADCV